MIPHGLSLRDYFHGAETAQLTIRRDDGVEYSLPVSYFFRLADEFSPIETTALQLCHGHVLDIGAGSGLHSLVLQSKGLTVTAIDVSPAAVEVMVRRGVTDAQVADVFQFLGGPFDVLLMLGHGIGIAEDLRGLNRLLVHARKLTRTEGRLLIHSLDVEQTDDPGNLAYHDANRQAGRYIGETRLQFEYRGRTGPYCGWLHVDPITLAEQAEQEGWKCEVACEQEGGDFLACLTRQPET